jgi:hypothetical protein
MMTVNEAITVTDAVQPVLQVSAQTITAPTFANHIYGDAAFSVSATASSGLPVTISIASGPATIANGVLDITGAGTVMVSFSQAGNPQYGAAPTVTQSFTVSPASATVTAINTARSYQTANPGLKYTIDGYVHGDTRASIAGIPAETTTAVLNSPAGNYPIALAQGTLSSTNYTFSLIPGVLTVRGGVTQTITFTMPTTIALGASTLTLTGHSTSALPITYAVSGPATISGSSLHLTGTGTVTVTASQIGNATFNPATPVSRTFTVTP